ncbi:conserved Plasmodium protein, unknown function [Plasmodium sp. DRC-Itaito]|nr:conserved Plasmodium protein, unknown function [Plasmodium sp. DRC-Itaito]
MTICSGCGVVTEVTICCPICLKNNKKIFYCSQECFEQNYKEHKKIHYLINIVSREEENHNKICENKLNAIKDDLPIIVLTNEHGTDINKSELSQNLSNDMIGNMCNDMYETSYYNNLSDSSTHNGKNNNNINVDKMNDNIMNDNIMNDNKMDDNKMDDNIMNDNKMDDNNNNNNSSSNKSYNNNNYMSNIIILQNENDRSNDTSFLHLYKSDNTKNFEDTHNYNNRDCKSTRSLTFEKLHRKNNYLKYKNIKDDHLLNNTNNEDKKQEENDENEYNNKNNLHSKNSFVIKVSYYLSYICSYIFSNKYHMLLPYYDDVSLTNEKKKKNFKSFKLKNKLSEHKIMELKKKIRIKKFVQLTLLLLLISIIVFISTYGFSYILEISQKKLQMNAEKKIMFNEENNKNQELQEIKSYINVIEDLRKEISEMKEILYVHNVILNKNFHLNNSYTLFNNKMKSANSSYNKKGSDNLGAITSHYYFDDTFSSHRDNTINNNHNNNNNNNNDSNNNNNVNYMNDESVFYVPTITQNEYDVKELYHTNQNPDEITLEKEKNYFDKKLSKEKTNETMSDIHSIPHNNDNKEDTYNNNNNNNNNDNNIKNNTEISNSTISQFNQHGNIEVVKTNNQTVSENINNYIKNHKRSISHNEEYAQVSNATVNEEDNESVNNKIILENMNNIKNTGSVSMDINNVSNNNFIQSHQIKDKYLNTSSKLEDSDKAENGDRKVSTNKMNKKKQNTI